MVDYRGFCDDLWFRNDEGGRPQEVRVIPVRSLDSVGMLLARHSISLGTQ